LTQSNAVFDILTSTHITDNSTFYKLNRKFDKKNKTRTFVGYATPKEILKAFPAHHYKSPDELTHERIIQEIKRGFEKVGSNTFCSDDFTKELVPSFFFFNALYSFANDFDKNGTIEDPVSLTRYDNGITKWHPGAKRMHLHQVYNKPIFFVLTDHSNLEVPTHIIQPINKTNFDWSKKQYDLRVGLWDARMHSENTNKNTQFKDVVFIAKDNLNKFDYWHTEKGNMFVLSKENITVNGRIIAKLNNNRWKVSFND
jgi:hypothetical protein